MLRRKRSGVADPSPTGPARRALVRRVRRAARRTIRLRLSESDLAPIGEDVDRLLTEADALELSPESQKLLLALDDQLSRERSSGGEDASERDGGGRTRFGAAGRR